MRGFTLIESLVYITLFGIILSTAFIGAESLDISTERTRIQSQLETEADFISDKISQTPDEIRLVGSSLVDVTGSSSTQISNPSVTVSKLYYISSAYYRTYDFSLITLTDEGQKISRDFSILIPISL